jgi:thiol:disulfide interchange protein DsbD
MIRKLVVCTLLLTISALAQEAAPIRWAFPDAAQTIRVKPGQTIRIRLAARIESGWHLYSMKELEGGPKPTRIAVPEGQPFALSGSIQQPEPIKTHDPNFDMDVEFYSDSAEFVLPVKVAANAVAGSSKLQVTVRFQSCNDQLCLPPRTVKLEQPMQLQ